MTRINIKATINRMVAELDMCTRLDIIIYRGADNIYEKIDNIWIWG